MLNIIFSPFAEFLLSFLLLLLPVFIIIGIYTCCNTNALLKAIKAHLKEIETTTDSLRDKCNDIRSHARDINVNTRKLKEKACPNEEES